MTEELKPRPCAICGQPKNFAPHGFPGAHEWMPPDEAETTSGVIEQQEMVIATLRAKLADTQERLSDAEYSVKFARALARTRAEAMEEAAQVLEKYAELNATAASVVKKDREKLEIQAAVLREAAAAIRAKGGR